MPIPEDILPYQLEFILSAVYSFIYPEIHAFYMQSFIHACKQACLYSSIQTLNYASMHAS